MATRTISDAGGGWNSVGTWAEGAVPVDGDDVVATATSGNLGLADTAILNSFNLAGYTGALYDTDFTTITVTTTFAGLSKTFWNVTFTGSGIATLTGSNTFNKLTVNPGKTLTFRHDTTQTLSYLHASGIAGQPTTLNTSSADTPVHLTSSTNYLAIEYASIQDIHVIGTAEWYALQTCTNVSGNSGWRWCATRTISAAGGDWTTTGCWVEGVVPVDGDSVVATSASGDVSLYEGSAWLSSVNFTNYHHAIDMGYGDGTFLLRALTDTTICKFTSAMTFPSGVGFVGIYITGLPDTKVYLDLGSKAFERIQITCINRFNEYYPATQPNTILSIQAAAENNRFLLENYTTLNTNGYTLVHSKPIDITTQNVTVNLGSSTVYCNEWDMYDATYNTLNAGTSTIKTDSANPTFYGQGKTYNNLVLEGTGTVNITGSNTFNNVTINAPINVRFAAGTTQTIKGLITTRPSAGGAVVIDSSSAGTPAHLSKSSGGVVIDYISIKDIHATGGATWYAGANSTNVSGNDGWIWTNPRCPVPGFFANSNKIIYPS